jgi:hypothetical protein
MSKLQYLSMFIGYLVIFKTEQYLKVQQKKSARILLFFQNSDEKLLIIFYLVLLT